jgi:hypothetical protein
LIRFNHGIDLNFGAVGMTQFGYLIYFGLITYSALYFGVLTFFLLRPLRSQSLNIPDKKYSSKPISNLRLYRRNLLSRRFN